MNNKEKIVQITDLVDGLKLYEWEKLKRCIDREFAIQANKTTFKTTETLQELLKLEFNYKEIEEVKTDDKKEKATTESTSQRSPGLELKRAIGNSKFKSVVESISQIIRNECLYATPTTLKELLNYIAELNISPKV